jgi:choline dehydrogenase-like flavoprotein
LSQGEIFDVCIVGSGAAGGVMAKELCEGGAKVVMLEAGREVNPVELLSHKWPYELPYRGLRGEKQATFYQGDISKSIAYADSDDVGVDRVRILGGRTMHWNAVTLRYAARDFEEWSTQGVEEDWPLTYEELEPYYDRIEQIIGVCGNDDHLEILPAGKHLSAAHPLALQRAHSEAGHHGHGHPAHCRAQGGPHPAVRQTPALPLLWPLHGRV